MRRFTLLVTLWGTLGCSASSDKNNDGDIRDGGANCGISPSGSDYAVYNALLAALVTECRPGQARFLVVDEGARGDWTTDSKNTRATAAVISDLLPATLDSFFCRNRTPPRFDLEKLKSPLPLTLLRPAEVGDVGDLMRANPDACALISLSAIGFDPPPRQALIYYSVLHDGLEGQGYFGFLVFDGTKWLIQQKVPLWVA